MSSIWRSNRSGEGSVVGIHPGQVSSPGLGSGEFQSRNDPLRLPGEDPDPGIFLRHGSEDLTGADRWTRHPPPRPRSRERSAEPMESRAFRITVLTVSDGEKNGKGRGGGHGSQIRSGNRRGSGGLQEGRQEPPGDALRHLGHVLRATHGHHLPTPGAGPGAQVDDPIGGLDEIQVVLDDHHRMPRFQKAIQNPQKLPNVRPRTVPWWAHPGYRAFGPSSLPHPPTPGRSSDLWASPPERVGAGWPRRRYPRPTCWRCQRVWPRRPSRMKKRMASSTVSSRTWATFRPL